MAILSHIFPPPRNCQCPCQMAPGLWTHSHFIMASNCGSAACTSSESISDKHWFLLGDVRSALEEPQTDWIENLSETSPLWSWGYLSIFLPYLCMTCHVPSWRAATNEHVGKQLPKSDTALCVLKNEFPSSPWFHSHTITCLQNDQPTSSCLYVKPLTDRAFYKMHVHRLASWFLCFVPFGTCLVFYEESWEHLKTFEHIGKPTLCNTLEKQNKHT